VRTTTALVREFHERMGCDVADEPTMLTPQQARLRLALMIEEVGEYAAAMGSDGLTVSRLRNTIGWLQDDAFNGPTDLVAAADGLGDIRYVVDGTAVAMGIPIEAVVEEIHRSNMTKTPGLTRADGKVLKGPAYQPPRIAEILLGNPRSEP
jgi:predicted HAD superfamily Cof-like phosphohydrolase